MKKPKNIIEKGNVSVCKVGKQQYFVVVKDYYDLALTEQELDNITDAYIWFKSNPKKIFKS